MATVNGIDLVFKKIPETTHKAIIDGDEVIPFAGPDGTFYYITRDELFSQLGGFTSGFQGDISIADVPTEDGMYMPTESGEYVNAGGIEVDLSSGVTFIVKKGTEFEQVIYPIELDTYLQVDDVSSLYEVTPVDFNSRVNFESGIVEFSSSYVCTRDFIPIRDDAQIQVRRGVNTGQSVLFYDKHKSYLSNVYIGSGDYGSATPPAGAAFVRMNISTNLSTRNTDVRSFGIYQKGIINTLSYGVATTDSNNLYNPYNTKDGHFIYSNGVVDNPPTNPDAYSVAFIELEGSETEISWRRSTGAAQLLAFFDNNMVYISGISGMSGVREGTTSIPSGAKYLLFNVSSSKSTRLIDKQSVTINYGGSINYSDAGVAYATTINGLPIKSYSHPLLNRKVIGNGDSIMSYSASPQDFGGNFLARMCRDTGALLVANYAIGGTTIAQRASEPTTRNPLVIRYTDMDDDADIVIMAAGTNDWNYTWTPIGEKSDVTPNTLYGALNILLPGLMVKYIGKQVVWITPMKRNYELSSSMDAVNGNGLTLRDYSEIIIERCAYWGVPVFDENKEGVINPFIPEHVTQLIPDGTHPNASGSQVKADRLAAFIRGIAM